MADSTIADLIQHAGDSFRALPTYSDIMDKRDAVRMRQLAQQRKQQAYDTEQATQARRQTLGQLAAGGKVDEAQNQALGAGDFDLAGHFGKMQDSQRAQIRAKVVAGASLLRTIRSQYADPADRARAIQGAASVLMAEGLTADEIARLPTDDQGIDGALATAQSLLPKLEQYTLAPGSIRFDANGRRIAEAPFAPQLRTVGEGQSLVEVQPGGGGQSSSGGFAPPEQALPGARVTSGYRSKERNAQVGGVPGSRHTTGNAFDVTPAQGETMEALAERAKRAYPGARVINEGDHVHVQGDFGGAVARGGSRVVAQGPAKTQKPPSGYEWQPDGSLRPIAGGPGDAKAGKSGRKEEVALRKEFDALPEVKTFKIMRDAVQQIDSLASNPNATAQDDIAAIFTFMRTLDPNSVVREGEFATAQNATGVPEQIRNLYNRAAAGNRLNPAQRLEMRRTAARIYVPKRKAYNEVAQRYRDYAKDSDLDPGRVAWRAVPNTAPAQGNVIRYERGPDGKLVRAK